MLGAISCKILSLQTGNVIDSRIQGTLKSTEYVRVSEGEGRKYRINGILAP